MKTKQFKSESKRLLDLMIHSIYTNKEIFIRELISNSSDAIDKLYYKTLTDDTISFNKEDFFIRIAIDKDARTLTITDTGIGMTQEELENNLGTIARSGSLQFKAEAEEKDGIDIIGQFGVGFYSAFMVSDCVVVRSKALNSDTAYEWKSTGAEGYTIEPCEKETIGTEIILTIKENKDEENYNTYLEEYTLKSLVKKYSDFIKYPIKMMETKSRLKEDTEKADNPEYEDYLEDAILNSQVPIWRKNKNELTEDDYNAFYREKHFGFDKPLRHIHSSVDGTVSYNSILYIPAKTPYDFYTKDFEKGLELYSDGVMIMEKCGDLLPNYFSFVQGIVDSSDLSLNISRELLQHDRQLRFIAKKIKEKIKAELIDMLNVDRDKYVEFFESFGKQLKFGLYEEYGMHKETLQDLIMFYSSTEKKMVTLSEYVSRMKTEQKYIYYATGDNNLRIENLPQTEAVSEKGYEILYFTDDIDEFAVRMLMKYEEKEFKNVSSGDLGLDDEDEKKETEEENKANSSLFDFMKENLSGKVKAVRISKRLKKHPVCLSTDGEMSIEMEKVLNTMPDNPGVKAEKVLEINPNHEIFNKVKDAYKNDKEMAKLYTELLYNQALLIEGLPVEDPVAFANDICKLMK